MNQQLLLFKKQLPLFIILPGRTDFSALCTNQPFLMPFLIMLVSKITNMKLLSLRHYSFILVSGERDGELKLKSYLILGNVSICVHFSDMMMYHL